MKLPLLLATTNEGKVIELRSFFQQQAPQLSIKILSLRDLAPIPSSVEETGVTFVENALLKAQAYFKEAGIPVLSDDSGLIVPALNGEPGVYSNRYAGENATSDKNIQKLLLAMQNISDRRAHFITSLVFMASPSLYSVSQGYCYGEITTEPRGQGGFGYDPIFFSPKLEKTLGEVSPEQKQKISHRSEALRNLLPFLYGFFHGKE